MPGNAKRKCIFNEELQRKYTCFKSKTSKHEALCTLCNVTVSIANKGKFDLEQHISSSKHIITLRGASSKLLCDYFPPKNTKLDDKVAAVEGTLAFHILKHHFSFKSSDCTTKLLTKMFNDSETAKRISSARTKTRSISHNVIAPYCIQITLESLVNIPFISVSSDGSNHGALKMFPLLVQFFDPKTGINTKMVNLETLPNETAETISEYIIKSLNSKQLLNKLVAFSADNCNTNFGGLNRAGQNNVYNNLKTKINVNLIGVGCPVHIVHNAAKHGFDMLSIDIESIALKIFNFFSIYTIRTESLKEFCSFVEIEYKDLLKHSSSRWLSLYPVINRILEIFPALRSYFLSLDNNCPVVLKRFFESNLSEGYLFFVHSLTFVFQEKTKEMEAEKNSILEVQDIITSLSKILSQRYENSFLPLKVKSIIWDLTNNGFENEANQLKADCFQCYKKSSEYLLQWTAQFCEFSCFKWMDLKNIPMWTDAEVCIKYLKEKNIEIDVDDSKCFDQFCNLQDFFNEQKDIPAFQDSMVACKWTKYFNKTDNVEFHSELLKICSFFFCCSSSKHQY